MIAPQQSAAPTSARLVAAGTAAVALLVAVAGADIGRASRLRDTAAVTVGASVAPVAALEGAWRRFGSDITPLVSDRVLAVAVDPLGTVFLRVDSPDDAADQIVCVVGGIWYDCADLRSFVEGSYDAIVAHGSLQGFWSVDAAGRAWIGPEYYAGQWRRLAGDDGPLYYDDHVVLDGEGTAWVPFGSCPHPASCGVDGLASFAPDGPLDRIVRFELAPEAGQYHVADVHLLDGPPGAPARASAAWAVSRRALYVLPDTAARPYPLLGLEPPPAPRNAGYATAATLRPDGRPVVIAWVEVHDDRDVVHRVLANTWLGDGWSAPDDLTAAPLLPRGAEFVRLTAAAYDPAAATPTGETLWVGASSGQVAARRDGVWVAHLDPADLGVSDAPAVRDLAVAPDGSVWAVGDAGVFVFERRAARGQTRWLPRVDRSRGR